MGLIIWLKRKITLIHDYHYEHVTEENIKPYTMMIGIDLIIMASSMLAAGIFLLITKNPHYFLIMGVGLLIGIIMFIIVQKKYNSTIMD